MTSIKISIGPLAIEVASDDIKVDLQLAIDAAKQLASMSPTPISMSPASSLEPSKAQTLAPNAAYDHGINTYVAKFGGESGRKILRSASFHLSLVDGLESFPKEALIARAREAREWKKDYVNTQATDLRRMVTSGDLIERSNGMFTVPTRALEEGKALLSQ